MSVPRIKLVLVILITMLLSQLTTVFATASSRPQWAREGVYFIYGVVRLDDKITSGEELESAINKWRFANIRDYETIIEVKFISVSELGVNYMYTKYYQTPTTSPIMPKTFNCRWDERGCGTDYGPFYLDLQRLLQELPVGTNESCRDYSCSITTINLNTISAMTRFGTLELYEYTFKYEYVYKYANGTIERQREHTTRFWIHKSTGIVIEAFYSSLELKECPPGKTCWTVGLVPLIDTNVPLGAEPSAPTQTPPQTTPTMQPPTETSPMPAQTPVSPTPTQVEIVKTPSPATPTQQSATPNQLSGMVIPIVVAVVGVVAVLAVFKMLRK